MSERSRGPGNRQYHPDHLTGERVPPYYRGARPGRWGCGMLVASMLFFVLFGGTLHGFASDPVSVITSVVSGSLALLLLVLGLRYFLEGRRW